MKKNIISGQMKKISYCAIALYVFCIVSTKAYSQDILKENIQANIHVDQIGSPIHPFTYGMFTELLHNMFENGIWAEMLSDRKFFYAVDNSETLEPRNTRRHQLRWRPIGPETDVIMDQEHVYVGKQSPKILLKSGHNGIKQAGLWLCKERCY